MRFNQRPIPNVTRVGSMRRLGLLVIYLVVASIAVSSHPMLAIAGEFEELQKLEDQLDALNNAARYPEAEWVARQILVRAERLSANQPRILAIRLGNLANTLDYQGKYIESVCTNADLNFWKNRSMLSIRVCQTV